MTKILLVEDDKALREIYGVRLLAEGYDIVSASDGEEALTNAINEHPDLIISDVMMPKISGFEMIDLLRTNEKTRDIKIIVMSALGGESQKERGRQLGADRYLVKSQVGIEDVVATVKQVLAEPPRTAASPANVQPESAPTPVPTSTSPATPNPAVTQPNQSPFNPIQATSPSTTAAVAPPALPSTPPSVPTIITTPSVPQVTAPNANNPTLPPIPLPTPQPLQQSQPAAPTPTSTPPASTESTVEPQLSPQTEAEPVLAPSAMPATGGIKVIQPTGTSLNPKIDIDNLLAREEASAIAPGLNMNPSPAVEPLHIEPSSEQVSTISIDPNGVINLDASTDAAS